MKLNSPIEQFELNFFYVYISNFNVYILFVFFFFSIGIIFILFSSKIFYIRPFFYFNKTKSLSILKYINVNLFSKFNLFIEDIFILFINLYNQLIIFKNNYVFFNFFFFIINFILLSNVFGLLPYSYVLTAQLIISINLSFLIFLNVNFIGITLVEDKFFNLFVPKGLNFYFHLLLIPLELISYLFRPISLSIRLFANLMSGHILLKVICSFFWNLIAKNDFIIATNFLFVVIILFFLETFVALIQAYVFFVLISLFTKDILILFK